MTSLLHRCFFSLAALTLVAVGCAGSSDVTETAVVAESSTTATVVETTVPTTPSTAPRTMCPEDESGALRAVIEAQTFAISQRDFVAALSYSSASFRSNTTAEQFERMISYEYGFLLRNPRFQWRHANLWGIHEIFSLNSAPNAATSWRMSLLQMKDGGALMLRLCLANLME